MPRDATETRARLIAQAERLFAERGINQATTREITAAACQRNASALHYHFGSREGILVEILRRHGDPMDAKRAALAGETIEAVRARSTRALLGALLVPYAAPLASPSGRRYLRIVAQLTDRFPWWRAPGQLNPPHLRRILAELEHRASADPAVSRERVVAVILLMTAAMAERARLIEGGGGEEGEGASAQLLEHNVFLANLADMLTGALAAPVGPWLEGGQAVQTTLVTQTSSPIGRVEVCSGDASP